MKKYTKCDFETNNKQYNICPICGEKLEIYKGKQKFSMGISGEDNFSADIEMTYDEALIVEKIINKLMESRPSSGYYGSVWIEDIGK